MPVPSEKRPTARVPNAPFKPCTPTAPTGSSTLSTLSINSIPNTTTKPEMIPMIAADVGETVSQPAVIATRPARDPFSDIETSGFLYLTHVMIRTVTVATAAARLVVTKILPAVTIASPSMLTVDAPLNPNQQNQRMNTPKAPMVRLCPGIAFDLPLLEYFPIRGPRMMAPIKAATPPTICTAQEPAKS